MCAQSGNTSGVHTTCKVSIEPDIPSMLAINLKIGQNQGIAGQSIRLHRQRHHENERRWMQLSSVSFDHDRFLILEVVVP